MIERVAKPHSQRRTVAAALHCNKPETEELSVSYEKTQAKLGNRSAGFTLVEVMIATALTLLLMAIVVQVFAVVGTAASDTREVLQVSDRLRAAKFTFQSDLANLTAPMLPPLKPEQGKGYFEYIEGAAGPVQLGSTIAVNTDELDSTGVPLPDTTVGDPDDILMFTTRNEEQPFYGRYRELHQYAGSPIPRIIDGTTYSQHAEIAWFVRGNTLYRRVLLVRADLEIGANAGALLSTNAGFPSPTYDISFYDKFDISVHQEGGPYDLRPGMNGAPPVLVANSLGDLSRRENRYGHQPWLYPYDVRFWGALGLPTLRECTFYTNMISSSNPAVARWPFPLFAPGVTTNLWGVPQSNGNPPAMAVYHPPLPLIYPYPNVSPANYQPSTTLTSTNPFVPLINLTLGANQYFDAWVNPYPWQQVSPTNGAISAFSGDYQPNAPSSYDGSTRVSDDVILTNVISFDVRAWDPLAPTIKDTSVTPNAVYMPGDQGFTNLLMSWANAGNLALKVQENSINRGAYVDLNYTAYVASQYPAQAATLAAISVFSGPGVAAASSGLTAIYDTGSFTYENDGIDQNNDYVVDSYTNGLDDNGKGGVDDVTEVEGPCPYPVPLKGIQVKIRVFEPDSRQIREVTITEDFH